MKESPEASAMLNDPQPLSSEQRRQNAREIADLLMRHYAADLLALGVYGSLARGTDGPFSDIEMHCIIRGEQIDTSFEWSTGAWKAEVDVYSPDVILATAAEVDGEWAITHGQFTGVWILHDPTGLFPRLESLALSQPADKFEQAMVEVIVGDIYELIGKLRNAQVRQQAESLPFYLVLLAQYAACLVGLANRRLYASAATLFSDSLQMPDRPSGYDALCRAVMRGELNDPLQAMRWAEELWRGITAWAAQRGLPLTTSLEELLAQD
ncbi:MAG: hypothetical protein MUC85_03795 [Anaerolineales bacterium]|jgi:kanamycin nucleotidyltransferase|nr:hypothetical protein [Anaerolineales bacterium]